MTKSESKSSTGDSKRSLPFLAADVARCDGYIYAKQRWDCPQRETCVRFLAPPIKDHPRQVRIRVADEDQVGNCSEFWAI